MSSLRTDVRTLARGWRWGRRPLVPRSVALPKARPRDFPTSWARAPAARAARAAIQSGILAPLLRSQTAPVISGLDVLDGARPPVLFYANHTSHLDAPMALTALPPAWRERTAVGAAADYFFDVWWRAAATALVFNAFPVERAGSRRSTRQAREMLAGGWNVLVFPEGTRSRDGWMGDFRLGAARLCVQEGVAAVPVALRGTFQAMPRGAGWPVPGRRPVSVRFGPPVAPKPGEDPAAFAMRMRTGLARLLDEDATTWWDSIRREARGEVPSLAGPRGPRWRRVWEASRPMPARRRRAWR
jgi:1-acyl-sn-glycerol-3-phosphate acyltransferase